MSAARYAVRVARRGLATAAAGVGRVERRRLQTSAEPVHQHSGDDRQHGAEDDDNDDDDGARNRIPTGRRVPHRD